MSLNILERQNNFIFFDEDNEEIKVTPQAMELPEVKVLFRRDKSMGKKFFKKNITFLYYTEHKDSPISHKLEAVKIKDAKRMYDWLRDFDHTNIHYIELKKVFKAFHYSMKEVRYLKVMEDVESMINMAMDVPLQIEKDIEFTRTISTFDEKGNPVDRTITLNEKILIDNSTEKTKAISNIQSLNKLVELLTKEVKIEYKREQSNLTRSMFDN